MSNYLEKKIKDLNTKFDIAKHNIRKSLKLLEEKKIHKNNVISLNETMKKDLDILGQKSKFGLNMRDVNNRMSDFYINQNTSLVKIKKYLIIIYWVILLPITILTFIKFKDKSFMIILSIFLIVPFFLNPLKDYFFDINENNCPTFIPSLGFESGGSKTCQVKKVKMQVDCVMDDWGPCNKRCGGGIQKRKVKIHPLYGGKACENLTRECNQEPCKKGESAELVKTTKPRKKENLLIKMSKNLWTTMKTKLKGAEMIRPL